MLSYQSDLKDRLFADSNFIFASVAQSVEQLIRNQQVAGSSPAGSSKKRFMKLMEALFLSLFCF